VRILSPGSEAFVRRAGSDLARGQEALGPGIGLRAGAIGLLSALGWTEIPCPRRPLVAVLTTGDEVLPPAPDAVPLGPGQIRDANGPALAAAVAEAGARCALRLHAPDDPEALRSAFAACEAAAADVIIAAGGVSVGDFDYVKGAAEERGALDFWRVAIKPGKPLAFGRIGGALFFGLPGNPVSALVTFELFVRPVLRRLGGFRALRRPRVSAVLGEPLAHVSGRREFVRAHLVWRDDTYHAFPEADQGSHQLAALARADALLIADEARGHYDAGEVVPALLLSGDGAD
jgi:molybdopterin molybdotransferase